MPFSGWDAFTIGAAVAGLMMAAGLGLGWVLSAWSHRRRETMSQATILPVVSSLLRHTSGIAKDVSAYRSVVELTQRLVEEARRADSSDSGKIPQAGFLAQLVEANEQLSARLQDAEAQLRQQETEIASHMCEARTDALTKLPNRRALDDELTRSYAQWRRYERAFSVLLVDLDKFKSVNDTYGHAAGDVVLRHAANVLRETLRETDLVARFGGEEFCAILTAVDREEALCAAERLRKALESRPVTLPDGTRLKVTASMGTATSRGLEEPAELIHRADEALYASKSAGRNTSHWHDGTTCHGVERSDAVETTEAPADSAGDRFQLVCADLKAKLLEVTRKAG